MTFQYSQFSLWVLIFFSFLIGCSLPHNRNYQDNIDDLNNCTFSSFNYRTKMIPYSQNNTNRKVYEKQDIVKNTKISFSNSNDLYEDIIDNEESYYIFCEDNGINYKLLKP